jgi:hypothetical protein
MSEKNELDVKHSASRTTEHTRLKSNKHYAELQLQRTSYAFNFASMSSKDKFCFKSLKTLGA